MTILSVDCAPNCVRVYNSLHLKLSSTTKIIVASIMRCTGKSISIEYCNVQWPSGENDSNLFALSFCTTLCCDGNPTRICDQPKL